MPRKLHNALTALTVKSAKPGRHADGGGLQLLVKETGARSWVYRFMLKGKSRDIGLGAAGPGGISLADARDLATALGTPPQLRTSRRAFSATDTRPRSWRARLLLAMRWPRRATATRRCQVTF